MDEVIGYLNLYKEAFPENPAFASPTGKKGAKAPAEKAPVQETTAPVDTTKVVEDALNLVADTVIFATLNQELGVELAGSNPSLNAALSHVLSAFQGLTNGSNTWSSAKNTFVDTLSRLVSRSATQVGSSTRSYSDLQQFVTSFSQSEAGATLLQGQRATITSVVFDQEEQTEAAVPVEGQAAEEQQYQEEEKAGE